MSRYQSRFFDPEIYGRPIKPSDNDYDYNHVMDDPRIQKANGFGVVINKLSDMEKKILKEKYMSFSIGIHH